MNNKPQSFRERVYEVIFEHNTPAGKAFDVILILCILLSVLVVMLDSVQSIIHSHGTLLDGFEWFFTILFTIEYGFRLYSIGNPLKYALSFYGVIDLLAILPSYIGLLIPGTEHLVVIRILRVLRIFRVLKIIQYVSEANLLMKGLYRSRHKIAVFLLTVMTLVVIVGSFMYLIEGAESGFTSIPTGVYWAIVTMTTVGYGDISPATPLGQTLASFIMIVGYSIIAIPTGIFTMEMHKLSQKGTSENVCPSCSAEDHDEDADFCKHCGSSLGV